MTRSASAASMRATARLLARIAAMSAGTGEAVASAKPINEEAVRALLAADLLVRAPDERLVLTAAGRAYLQRAAMAVSAGEVDRYRGQHLALVQRDIATATGKSRVQMDDGESPLAWLARRKGKDGQPLIAPHQFLAGERLRAEFTRAQLMPRVTSNWDAAVAQGARSGDRGAASMTEHVIAARQRVRQALCAVGPEFAGLLIDVCCFLKGLEIIERERGWPTRAAKVVLQLALERLARHYGYAGQARGRAHAPVRIWIADDFAFTTEAAPTKRE